MRVVIAEATGTIGSVVVQRLHAEGTHDLADVARRLPEGPGSRGADRRSVDLSTDACHDALVEAPTGADAVGYSASGLLGRPAGYSGPGIVGPRDAGGSLLRSGVPALVHGRALGLLPALPMDRVPAIGTAVLRPRTVLGALGDTVHRGAFVVRRLP